MEFIEMEMLPNFLKFQVLGRLANSKATRHYGFIGNNHTSFHLQWKENLLNHQKVSSHYKHDRLQDFP